MARFEMDDGTIVDTQKAQKSWEEETDFDGHNHISRATGSQWEHETLYRSAKGRYYVATESVHKSSATFVDDRTAATWLLKMEHDLPKDLKKYEEEVVE
jgi:hypothetical protein